MSLRFQEGFENISDETQGARKYAVVTNGWPTSISGRWNTAFRAAQSPDVSIVTVPLVVSVANTWTIGFGYRAADASTNAAAVTRAPGFRLLSGGTSITANEQVSIEMQPEVVAAHEFGRYQVVVRRGATVLGTSTIRLMPLQWYYIEFQVVVRTGTNGSFIVKIHEWPSLTVTTTLNISGVNTANLGSDGADRLAIVWDSVGTTADNPAFDDIYCRDDSTFMGNLVIEGLDAVDGNGDTAQWELQGSATNVGNALLDADNSNPSLEDRRIVSDTVNQISLANFGDLTFLKDGAVHFVSMSMLLRMESSGTRTVKPVFRHKDPGPTNFEGDNAVLIDTDWTQFSQLFELNPVTTIAWDHADVNLGQWGVKLHA